MRISRQGPAFILHARPYRTTSALVKFFSQDYGVLSGIVRGIKGQAAKNSALIQPFVPLSLQWTDRTELKTITALEEQLPPIALKGERLFSALYINELLYRLLQEGEPFGTLFALYRDVLTELAHLQDIEPVLRRFEKALLNQLGYGVSYTHDAQTELALDDRAWYRFVIDEGFIRMEDERHRLTIKQSCYQGWQIRALATDDYSQLENRRVAKQIMRESLAFYLGGQPLNSRNLFIKSCKE